ncbi:Uncharacterised protein [Mycobacterium tuberculosis]|nr:Uncharacterised protein [Mycobacterium tuberculosis]
MGRQVQQPNQTCLSLDEGANRRALVLTNDEISFPVARLGAVGGIERPLVNRQHRLGEARAATARTQMGAAMSSSRAQRATVWRLDLRRPDQS